MAYQYEPLPEGRLIRLASLSHEGDEEVPRCSLETFDLNNLPVYHALSYTWGSPSDEASERGINADLSCSIFCSGSSMSVTRNLYDFLCRWRKTNSDSCKEYIWIDAICINQADPTERGSQIGLMRDIYSSAKSVIVWLGEENKHTLAVVDLIQRLPSIPMDRLRTINPLDLANTRTKAMMQLGDWKGCAELFQRAWFYRTWIIQEIAVASKVTVICGSHIILWEDLLYISEVFSTSKWGTQVLSIFHKPGCGGLTVGATPYMLDGIRKGILEAGGWTLDALVFSARPFLATDPKDKIYALLGLARASSGSELNFPRPDYNLLTSEVYIDAMRAMLEDSRSFLLLSTVEDKSQRIVELLPSWVPDFSFGAGASLGMGGKHAYSAAGDLPKGLRPLGEKRLLGITGSELDEIVEVGESMDEINNGRSLIQCLKIVSQLPPTYFTGQSRLEVFWRTLVADIADGQHPAPESLRLSFRYWVMFEMANAFIDKTHSTTTWDTAMAYMDDLARSDLIGVLPTSERILNFAGTYERERDKFEDYSPLVSAATKLHTQFQEKVGGARPFRIFITRKGYLGLGQLSLRVGDCCWIIPGACVPFILRSKGEGRYHLVGETYVHGFMHGETLEQEEFGLKEIELE
jgi:hypothetical protein